MEQLLPIIQTAVATFVNLTHRKLMEETIQTHRAVQEAIDKGDSVGARCAMIMHLTYNRQMLIKMKEDAGMKFHVHFRVVFSGQIQLFCLITESLQFFFFFMAHFLHKITGDCFRLRTERKSDMAQHVYGIDLGTSNIKMYSGSSDNILNEKNVIAIKNKNELFEIGDEAFKMYEKAPDNIKVIFPIKFGVIADLKSMKMLFKAVSTHFNNSAYYNSTMGNDRNFCSISTYIDNHISSGTGHVNSKPHSICDRFFYDYAMYDEDEDLEEELLYVYGRNVITGLPSERGVSKDTIFCRNSNTKPTHFTASGSC